MSAREGRTWASIGRSAPVRVTSRQPGLDADTRESSILFTWTEADPAAVTLLIDDPWNPGESVEWTIARNTLFAAHLPGMQDELVGLGDVRVRSSAGDTSIWIGTPDGAAAFSFASQPVVELLAECARVVPLGEAEAQIYADAIDAELAALLDGAQ